MTNTDHGVDAAVVDRTSSLLTRLGFLYLSGVAALVTLAYEAFVTLASMMPGRPAPLWQYLLGYGVGLIGVLISWFAGKAYLRSCRGADMPPARFAVRWLGGPLALVAFTGLAFVVLRS